MDLSDITKAKQGDKESLAKLLKENYTFILKYVWKMCGNEQTAYDVTQETLIKAVQKIQQYKEKSSFSTWLIQIATHTYLDMNRKQKRTTKLQQLEKDRMKQGSHSSITHEEWYDVQEALWKLEDQYRIPIVLKHYYGYEYDEISSLIKVKTGTLKSRVHYGLEKLRKELNHDD
ncbi:RNA polymerase sigma factor SigY [Halobacillus litoralis]|uniref:RNA polymerase sigma factor SigY n=1 Tax=Halobacillus litoralis TaxID=45668 RepID=UPI001CFCACC8|nr:RNA polymerase sigma factor SigY [Halobacillus litoralis]